MTAEEIRQLRVEKLMLTQAELAEKLGVDISTVKGWEQGRQKPRLKHIRRLRELELKKLAI